MRQRRTSKSTRGSTCAHLSDVYIGYSQVLYSRDGLTIIFSSSEEDCPAIVSHIPEGKLDLATPNGVSAVCAIWLSIPKWH